MATDTSRRIKEQRGHVMLKMQADSLADLVRIAARLRIDSSGSEPDPPTAPQDPPPPHR